MKEQSAIHPPLSASSILEVEQEEKKLHCRGDKVVVNGAKESLLAILRRYKCGCGKHTLQKLTTKFLSSNKITASYDIVVWMLLYIQRMTQFSIYSEILKKYLQKMNYKYMQKESHDSAEYIQSKKQTLKKFIKSAQALDQEGLTYSTFQKSIIQLYAKPKSAENAANKIKTFLRNRKIQTESSCFLKQNCETKKNQSKNYNWTQQKNQLIQLAQQNLEQICSKQQSKEDEHIQESTQILIIDQMSFDLFDGHRSCSKVQDQEGFSFIQLNLVPEKSSNSSGDLLDQLIEESQLGYFW